MSPRLWYPYAPDQAFGVRLAADSDRVERFLDEVRDRQGDDLATTATALEAATEIGRDAESM